jgi:hypothetical protein
MTAGKGMNWSREMDNRRERFDIGAIGSLDAGVGKDAGAKSKMG